MKIKTTKPTPRLLSFLTEGLTGAVLIRRRQAEVCIACGLVPVHAVNASSDLPWLCDACLERPRPKRRTFNHKKHRADGIANLDRILGTDNDAG